jgi:hypothetical protein
VIPQYEIYWNLAQSELLNAYDNLKEDQPCEICDQVDDKGVLCDLCDKPYHKSCLGDLYIERNPVSWFCPSCEKLITEENSKDPYFNHDLLNYLHSGDLPDNIPPAEIANLAKLA